MATDTQLTGADSPIKIGGQQFSARTLNDKDHAELNEYIRTQMINMAKATLTDYTPTHERHEIIMAAISAAAGITWASMEGGRIMATVDGQIRLAWQMTKHSHRLKLSDFEKIFRRDKDSSLEETNITFLRLNTEFKEVGEAEVMDEAPEEDASDSKKSN